MSVISVGFLKMCGWIEVAQEQYHELPENPERHLWISVVDVGSFIGAEDILCDRLFFSFDEMEYPGTFYDPVVGERGIPADASDRVRREASLPDSSHATWITWAEVKSAWDDKIGHYFLRDGISEEQSAEHNWHIRDWDVRDVLWREMIGATGKAFLEMMEALAKVYGDHHVRLIVWFERPLRSDEESDCGELESDDPAAYGFE